MSKHVRVELTLWEVKRLLQLLNDIPQEMIDGQLWRLTMVSLKLDAAKERLEKK